MMCTRVISWVLILNLFALSCFAEMESEPVPIVLRGPAAETQDFDRERLSEITARIETIYDHKSFSALSVFSDWSVGEIVAVESQAPGIGIIAFVEVTSVERKAGSYLIKFNLLRHSRNSLVQVGDSVFKLNLSAENPRYKGTTDLIIRTRSKSISSRYKPLTTQGVNIGETAQTLWKNEMLMTWYGLFNYGFTDKLMAGTVIPFDLAGSTNLQLKLKVLDTDSNVVSTGLSYATIKSENRSTLNFNFFWDGISSETQISHTFITIALFSFEQAKDSTAIRSLGTSTFQSGYEFIFNDWDRLLIGPSYNFEKKAVGGYASYVQIWEKFHFAVSLNSTDISSFRYSFSDGYYLGLDAYWRF